MNQEIYQDIILSHFRYAKWKQDLTGQQGVFSVKNPSCGDLVRLHVSMTKDEKAIRVVHDTQGCAASVASCSIMCDSINGLSLVEAEQFVNSFLRALESEGVDEAVWNPSIEIEALLFFRNISARRQCVSLAWNCAENALATLLKEG